MAEPLKATFFALQPRDRMVLLPATLVTVAIIVALLAAFAALNWATILQFRDLIAQSASTKAMSDDESVQFVFRFFGLFGWLFIFSFPIYIALAAYEAACLRWMIRGEAPGLFGITLDNDTWRVWGVYWAWFLANFVISFAMSILIMPIMFMTMGDIMQNPTPEAMQDWQMRVQLPVTIAQYIPMIFIGVRFGPAAATSVGLQRFAFFTAWTVTRDRFWSLLGSFFVLWLALAVLMTVVVGALYAALMPEFSADVMANWRTMTPQQAALQLMTPQGWTVIGASYAIYLLLFVVYAVLAFGSNARAVLAALEEGKIEKPTAAA
jgi:hypothetical protein